MLYNVYMTFIRFMKRFGRDIAGYTLLVLALPIGLLPGPGGIPVLFAGLGLLAKHNLWARKLLLYAEKHSQSFRNIFFPKNKSIQRLWDAISVILFCIALLLALLTSGWVSRILPTSFACIGILVFLCNRSRLDSLLKQVKH